MQALPSIFKDVEDNLGAGLAASSEDSVPGCSRGEKHEFVGRAVAWSLAPYPSSGVGILGKVSPC